MFANGLGIYLTSFSLSVPLCPPCEAIQSPETPSPSHRIEALQGKRPPGWGKVLRRRSRGASPRGRKWRSRRGPVAASCGTPPMALSRPHFPPCKERVWIPRPLGFESSVNFLHSSQSQYYCYPASGSNAPSAKPTEHLISVLGNDSDHFLSQLSGIYEHRLLSFFFFHPQMDSSIFGREHFSSLYPPRPQHLAHGCHPVPL